jgi:hypothetical protein
MANWKVSTIEKKSCEERETWTKDDQKIVYKTGYRWGTFIVKTTDESPPNGITTENINGIDIYNLSGENIESIELESMDDGCYAEYECENLDEDSDDFEELEEALEDDYFDYLMSNGWSNDETERWLFGPLEIKKID